MSANHRHVVLERRVPTSMPTGVHLSDEVIWEWVKSATRNVLERENAFEAISFFQRERRGYVTLRGIEELFRQLVDNEDILFTKYTARYMLENLPEELSS